MSTIVSWLQNLSVADRRQVARRVGTSEAYLRQVASGHRKASASMAFSLGIARSQACGWKGVECPTCGDIHDVTDFPVAPAPLVIEE